MLHAPCSGGAAGQTAAHPFPQTLQRAFCAGGLLLLAGCASGIPTLVEVAQRRAVGPQGKIDSAVNYAISDRDVLEYTNQAKIVLLRRFSGTSALRYGSSLTQTTLSALAGAASTAGWSVAAASGLGAGSTFVSGLGATFDVKTDAQAFEAAYTDIQRAEANFYFFELGGKFNAPDSAGKITADFSKAKPRGNIPNQRKLTPNGEVLYYRVVSVLKVLDDVLAKKIPDLQTLKDAKGDMAPAATPPPPPAGSPAPLPG